MEFSTGQGVDVVNGATLAWGVYVGKLYNTHYIATSQGVLTSKNDNDLAISAYQPLKIPSVIGGFTCVDHVGHTIQVWTSKEWEDAVVVGYDIAFQLWVVRGRNGSLATYAHCLCRVLSTPTTTVEPTP